MSRRYSLKPFSENGAGKGLFTQPDVGVSLVAEGLDSRGSIKVFLRPITLFSRLAYA
jgi:hypothetical protein